MRLNSMRRWAYAVIISAFLLALVSGCEPNEHGDAQSEREEVSSYADRGADDRDLAAGDGTADVDRPSGFESTFLDSISREAGDNDSRWPTTNPQLLAIPEENRYYNAWNHVWTTCTVAGPVVNVYQAKDAAGAPIFISIGDYYPSPSCVTLVIWADAYNDFAQMINEVDDGGAWLSVTGYLSEYNGGLQFDISDGYVEYTWWGRAG